MASDEPTPTPAPEKDGGDDSPQSVFGNLPRERPGARSPRRDEQATAGAASARPSPAQTPGAEPSAATPRASPEDGPASDIEGGGIEDVAWAGVAAAAEAATIGVRLATRALEAMRDAVDRR